MPAKKFYKEDDESTTSCTSASASISMDGSISIISLRDVSKAREIEKSTLLPSLLRHTSDDYRKEELNIMSSPRNHGRACKVLLSNLTINKLDLKSLGLVGRDQELSILRSSFSRLCSRHSKAFPSDFSTTVKNELVFIRGYSGIGKSTLVKTLQKDALSSNSVYSEGKYEFSSLDEPYSGVAQAFSDLCNSLKDRPDILAKVTDTINDTMKKEAEILKALIPELSIFLDDENDCRSVQSQLSNDHGRWKHAFRMLTRIIGSHFSAIVMVLDDIQWADAASLDIMDFLISDVENPHPLMVIGCYRSNEVNENSILYNRIRTLQDKEGKFGFRITDIELQNFDLDKVNTMIMTMLSIDDESKTRDLSAVCFKRTLGNPFFLIEFMKMLQSEDLLDFNLGLMKWVWDVSKIEDATMSTSNVVELVHSRMRKLPADIQVLLQHAACLGSSLFLPTLELVSKHALPMSEDNDPNLMGMLEVVLIEKLIEFCGPNKLRWVHDKVREAAFSLSDLVTPSFQFDLGVYLYEGLNAPQLQKQLFNVADLVNKGNVTERPNLSELNLRAAKKAHEMAAFQSGAHYVSCAIRLLPSDTWTQYRNLALELYSLGAEMNVALGNINLAKEYIRVIIDKKIYSPMEIMRLKMARMEIIDKIELRHSDAVDYGLQVLKGIGYRLVSMRGLVPTGIQALALLWKTIKRLEKLPVDHFDSVGFIQDPQQKAIVDLLSKVTVAAYEANDKLFFILCNCKIIELTLEYGLHCNSAAHVALVAMLVMVLKNDHETSSHFCDIASAIQKRFGIRRAGETIHYCVAFTLGYIKPLHEMLPPLMDGYLHALRDGDNFSGIWNLMLHSIFVPYIMGRPLRGIADNCQRISAQIEEFKIAEQIFSFRMFWQMILNLQLTPCESSKKLEGECINLSSESMETPIQIGIKNLAFGELLLFFGDYKARVERLFGEEKKKTYPEVVPGYLLGRIETFHRGIVWFAMARRKGKRKYRAQALKVKKLIAKWATAGDPNVQHFDRMLSAEEAALSKRYELADQFYKEAIALASRSGHLHHAALFNERFGEYRLEVHGDVEDSKYYMQQAIKYYTEWGAVGKAEELERKVKRFDEILIDGSDFQEMSIP